MRVVGCTSDYNSLNQVNRLFGGLRHNCRLRIDMSAGLVEGILSMERTAGAKTALASIKKFLTKVEYYLKKG
jgi:hypothetical protein